MTRQWKRITEENRGVALVSFVVSLRLLDGTDGMPRPGLSEMSVVRAVRSISFEDRCPNGPEASRKPRAEASVSSSAAAVCWTFVLYKKKRNARAHASVAVVLESWPALMTAKLPTCTPWHFRGPGNVCRHGGKEKQTSRTVIFLFFFCYFFLGGGVSISFHAP